ncbi:MAG TPA: desulfoferrodoxin [Candidatus Brocadiia bacterium]|nr:desulfoferrodoxin [Candidatus Brocadiia bacterium]
MTLKVGKAYACRACGNLVMVTRGGVGVLDLVCCGKPMEEVGQPCDGEK